MESEGVVPLNNPTFDPKMTNHSIDIYYFPGSPPCRAVLMLLKALNIKHNIKIINLLNREQMSPEFLKINPTHTIPAINDNGFTLWESHVIMKYLVDQYAKDDSLYPRDAKKGAIVNLRLFFNAGTLWPRLTDYMLPILFMGQAPDPAKAEKIEEALGTLDSFVKEQSWMAGSYLTIADFAIVAVIAQLEAVMFDISKFPNLDGWYGRARRTMAGYGYEEVNQAGADKVAEMFKNKIENQDQGFQD